MPSAIQRSFAGGEIGAELYGRADQVKYQTGLRTCRNNIVRRSGAISNRAGTQFIAEAKDNALPPHLLKFVFNQSQSYVLEFGNEYVRFYKNGARVTVSGLAAWLIGTTYAAGDLVAYGGTNYYSRVSGNLGNQPDVSPSEWYAMLGNIYEIPSPYFYTDTPGIQYAQSADVVVLVNHYYPPYELKRYADTTWILEPIVFRPSTPRPTGCAGVAGAAGTGKYKYRVTAVDRSTGEESLQGTEAPQTIIGATQADPVVVTVSGTGAFDSGSDVFIDGIIGMTELNGRTFLIDNVATVGPNTTFELSAEDGTGYTAYSSAGTAARAQILISSAAVPSSSSPNVLTWTAVANATYRIYRKQDGYFGLIGTSTEATFDDTGITASTSVSHPIDYDVFLSAGNYPSAVAYHQQRLFLANTINNPEGVWASRTNYYHNFSYSFPVASSDPVEFIISSQQVNEVRHMVGLGRLVVFTSQSEWTIEGDADGTITPVSINARQQGLVGASIVRPAVIGNVAIFAQARGQNIRDLRYSFESGGYVGTDLSTFAPHLFSPTGKVAYRMDFQQTPSSVAWIVQENGALVAMTYVPEHEIVGWHRHDSVSGQFIDVVVVPEGNEDVVYVLVKRTINSVVRYYVERMASRSISYVATDAKFVDSFLTYDGRNLTLAGVNPAATMLLSGGINWTPDEVLSVTASSATFATSNIGDDVHLRSGSDFIRARIVSFASSTSVSVKCSKTVPASLRSIATTDWALAVDKIYGLGHLEGEEIRVLGDGFSDGPFTVSSGYVTMSHPFAIVHAGLPITADLETLEPENAQAETLLDKTKRFNRVTLLFNDSRGGWVGPDESHLTELMQGGLGTYDDPIPLLTGAQAIRINATWSISGRVLVRQVDPLPMTVMAIAYSGSVGG